MIRDLTSRFNSTVLLMKPPSFLISLPSLPLFIFLLHMSGTVTLLFSSSDVFSPDLSWGHGVLEGGIFPLRVGLKWLLQKTLQNDVPRHIHPSIHPDTLLVVSDQLLKCLGQVSNKDVKTDKLNVMVS